MASWRLNSPSKASQNHLSGHLWEGGSDMGIVVAIKPVEGRVYDHGAANGCIVLKCRNKRRAISVRSLRTVL